MSSETTINLDAMEVLAHANNERLLIPNCTHVSFIENSGDHYSVFVQCDVEDFLDSFNGIEVIDSSVNLPQYGEIKGIRLSCTASNPRQFFMIVIDFLDYIEDNDNTLDIEKWCESWKELVGNKYTNNRVYDVLAELMVYSYLQSRGYEPVWSGPDRQRHDFRCRDMDCEVKSTVARTTEAIVTIHGGGQLGDENKPVKLFVCQMEQSSNGLFSVQDLLNNLLRKGVDKGELTTQFKKTCLNSSRDKNLRFNLLHPIKVYDADSTFPKVDKHQFKNDDYPTNVINVSYTVSLAGIKHREIAVSLNGKDIIFEDLAENPKPS